MFLKTYIFTSCLFYILRVYRLHTGIDPIYIDSYNILFFQIKRQKEGLCFSLLSIIHVKENLGKLYESYTLKIKPQMTTLEV
jgi:hypothetical protein